MKAVKDCKDRKKRKEKRRKLWTVYIRAIYWFFSLFIISCLNKSDSSSCSCREENLIDKNLFNRIIKILFQ